MISMNEDQLTDFFYFEPDWWFDNTNEASEARDYYGLVECLLMKLSIVSVVSENIHCQEIYGEENE